MGLVQVVSSCAGQDVKERALNIANFTGERVGLLTVRYMRRAVDRAMTIGDVGLPEKSGGKSGHYRHPET